VFLRMADVVKCRLLPAIVAVDGEAEVVVAAVGRPKGLTALAKYLADMCRDMGLK
jgi:hypothetical protein